MIFTWIQPVALLVCALVATSGAHQEADVAEFEQLKTSIFGQDGRHFAGLSREQLYRLGVLLEEERVPVQVQGELTFEWLDKVVSVCEPIDRCDVAEHEAQLAELMRPSSTFASQRFHDHLRACDERYYEFCTATIYGAASERLAELKPDHWRLLRRLAEETVEARSSKFAPDGQLVRKYRDFGELDFSELASKALGASAGALAAAKRTCLAFLQKLDPRVKTHPFPSYLSDSEDPEEVLGLWSYYNQVCEQVDSLQ